MIDSFKFFEVDDFQSAPARKVKSPCKRLSNSADVAYALDVAQQCAGEWGRIVYLQATPACWRIGVGKPRTPFYHVVTTSSVDYVTT